MKKKEYFSVCFDICYVVREYIGSQCVGPKFIIKQIY